MCGGKHVEYVFRDKTILFFTCHKGKVIIELLFSGMVSEYFDSSTGALQKQQQSDISYREVVKASSNDVLMTSKQIEKDLLRTMPTNACFSQLTSTGIPRLRRVLRALAWLYPDIG